jgi:hypothetical protein
MQLEASTNRPGHLIYFNSLLEFLRPWQTDLSDIATDIASVQIGSSKRTPQIDEVRWVHSPNQKYSP